MPLLTTRQVKDTGQIREFFDGIADQYVEAHGNSIALLRYRLSNINNLRQGCGGTVLEIGCGTGSHLFLLAEYFSHVIGSDFSPGMIAKASEILDRRPDRDKIEFMTDTAEKLSQIKDQQIDTVVCIGALEHMPDKDRVFRSVARVLKPGGEFICLTLNARYCWYGWLSKRLNLDSKHLSTDQILTQSELAAGLEQELLLIKQSGFWTFIPRGDMPLWLFYPLKMLDYLARIIPVDGLRGGLYFRAIKPSSQVNPDSE